jgi:dipeptidyl aminopeptidase/acylaminoacyl peptidase
MKFLVKSIAAAAFCLGAYSPALSIALADQQKPNSDHMRTFEAMDVFELEVASSPAISPDGSKIIYVRAANDIMSDGTRANLWIMNGDGSDHRPLLSGRTSYSPVEWSPDGSRIAYVSDVEGSPQLYVRWMDTGATALVTNLQKPPSSIEWSPDGSQIAFTMSVDAPNPPMVPPRAAPQGAEWAEPFNMIESLIYRFNGRGYIKPAHSHVFVVPSTGGTARQVTSGDFQHRGPLSWTADSSEILISTNRHEGFELETIESDVFSVNVADGTITAITTEDGAESSPKLSPDGTRLAYIKQANEALTFRLSYLVVADADGSNPQVLMEDLDRSVSNINWAADGSGLYFQYTNHGIGRVGFVDLDDNRRDVADGLGGLSTGRPYTAGTYDVAENGTIVFTLGKTDRPADLAITTGGPVSQVTWLNEDLLGHMELAELHNFHYASSFDGAEIEGWYLTPPGFDPEQKYPLILEIHGGPNASYGPFFSAEMQLMASAGYVVFYDNYRGSTSYGRDFALLLQYKYSSPEDYADHDSGVNAVIDMGFIDVDNTFITGGSAGGIATAYAVGLTDRYNAAVAAKPIINWISKTLTGDIYTYQIRHQFPGMPWDELEHYWSRSPLSMVGDVTTPTMLMTGEEDFRTPISESEQFYQALKLRGIDTALVRVPGSPHGIAGRPSRLIQKVDHILAWFERYKVNHDEEMDSDSEMEE